METKFTKGNWKIGESGLSVICDNDYVCTCHHEAEQLITEEQAKSNAKLIAAAPELLEVIQSALRISDLWTMGENVSMEHEQEAIALNNMKREFKQAIQKAIE